MPDAREVPKAVQWHEGMLLVPQHFQQQSLRHEALIHYHTSLIAPFHTGIHHLKVDPGLLVNGILRVLELEAVMPDGLVVSQASEDAEALEIDLNPFIEETPQSLLTVHLAVPAGNLGGTASDGDLTRYASVESDPVVDANTGEGGLRIPCLRPNLSLLVTETPPRKYAAFPLVKVEYRDQTFSLADFIAPALAVPVQSPIGEICSLIVKRLREKAAFLSDKVRTSAATLELPLILEMKATIQSLVAPLPPLESVLYTGVAHPYALYLALCSVVGNLASLGPGLVPPVLAPYNHNDLRFTFEQVREFIFRMIDEGILEAYTAIPFHFEEGAFALAFQEAWMSMPFVVGARRQPGQSESEVASWIGECLIGSRPRIQSMREKRILGAARQQIDRDEDLVTARDMVFFHLEADPQFVDPNEELHVFNTGDPTGVRRPAEVVLYIRNGP